MIFNAFISIILLGLISSYTNALKISKGSIQLNKDEKYPFGFTDVDIELTQKHKIVGLEFDLTDDEGNALSKQPIQVIATFASGDLETYFYPVNKYDSHYVLKLLGSEIPQLLKLQDSIDIKIITGDEDSSLNLIESVGTLYPTKDLKQSIKYEKPVRFGIKEEIRHVFRSAPTTINPLFSTIFVAIIGALFFALLFAWFSTGAINLNNLTKLPIGHTVYFFTAIALLEATFFSYYLETSIFDTMLRTGCIGVFAIFVGSRVLRGMYDLRKSNLR